MSQFKRVFSAFLCGETVSLWGLQIIADHSYFSVYIASQHFLGGACRQHKTWQETHDDLSLQTVDFMHNASCIHRTLHNLESEIEI